MSEEQSLFWTPAEISANWVAWAEEARRGGGITWGVPSMDAAILPLRPGKILAIVARPGHGKTTTAVYLAKRTARTLSGNHFVLYLSVDQPIEEIETIIQAEVGCSVSDLAWGRVDLDVIRKHALRRATLPIWLMGKSAVEQRRQARMTFSNVYKEIEEIEGKFHCRPALLVIDYIQNFPVERGEKRSEQVTEAICRARELCLGLRIPLIICAQAARSVDDRAEPIPQPRDCQHASAIEQEADAIVGIWRPCLTQEEGSTLEAMIQGRKVLIPVTQNLFIVQLVKQRGSPAGQIFRLHFDPGLVQLSDLEIGRG